MHQQPTACLEIFRAGTHTSVDGRVISFTPEAVAELAESYDPGLSEAPMVIGHPALDAPAYGWARSLRADNGVLFAEPHQVEAQFAEGVNAGRYKKVSACIYLPASPRQPEARQALPAPHRLPGRRGACGEGAALCAIRRRRWRGGVQCAAGTPRQHAGRHAAAPARLLCGARGAWRQRTRSCRSGPSAQSNLRRPNPRPSFPPMPLPAAPCWRCPCPMRTRRQPPPLLPVRQNWPRAKAPWPSAKPPRAASRWLHSLMPW